MALNRPILHVALPASAVQPSGPGVGRPLAAHVAAAVARAVPSVQPKMAGMGAGSLRSNASAVQLSHRMCHMKVTITYIYNDANGQRKYKTVHGTGSSFRASHSGSDAQTTSTTEAREAAQAAWSLPDGATLVSSSESVSRINE